MGQSDEELIDKIWSSLHERQRSINKYMEESEKKILQQAEENRLIMEQAEKKYFERLEEDRLLMEKSEKKYFGRLEEERRQLEEIWEKIYKELVTNRAIFENNRNENKQTGGKKSKQNKQSDHQIELTDHPIYTAILKLFSERGYKIDSDTIKLYWEMISLITHSLARQDD